MNMGTAVVVLCVCVHARKGSGRTILGSCRYGRGCYGLVLKWGCNGRGSGLGGSYLMVKIEQILG
jgi:hypothetical protein